MQSRHFPKHLAAASRAMAQRQREKLEGRVADGGDIHRRRAARQRARAAQRAGWVQSAGDWAQARLTSVRKALARPATRDATSLSGYFEDALVRACRASRGEAPDLLHAVADEALLHGAAARDDHVSRARRLAARAEEPDRDWGPLATRMLVETRRAARRLDIPPSALDGMYRAASRDIDALAALCSTERQCEHGPPPLRAGGHGAPDDTSPLAPLLEELIAELRRATAVAERATRSEPSDAGRLACHPLLIVDVLISLIALLVMLGVIHPIDADQSPCDRTRATHAVSGGQSRPTPNAMRVPARRGHHRPAQPVGPQARP